MDKMSVVLDKKGAALSMDGKSLRIDSPGQPLQRIPLGMVSQVIVYGNPGVGCDVWRKLSEYGIPSLLLPARGKGEGTWVGPGLSTAVMVRITQFRAWSDAGIKKEAAAWLLKEKFKALQILSRAIEGEPPFIKKALERLDLAVSTDEIRGIEGNAAREWFGLMRRVIPGAWGFKGRNRRPPKDPVNALLSLGYTLLGSEVQKSVTARGLDPGIGFLHSPYPGRDSLSLDVMEPLRPGVDAFVLSLTSEDLEPDDFSTGLQEGCRLSKAARGIFYGAWEEWKQNWPLSPGNKQNTGDDTPNMTAVCNSLIERFIRSWNLPDPLDELSGGRV